MTREKKTQEKFRLHARNRNREPYDLKALTASIPALATYVKPNKHGVDSVDFASPAAVKLLNQALLHHYYGIPHWEFPDENLCPPVPGRADYIHAIADLLREKFFGNVPEGSRVTGLDVGVGASCIYPVLGIVEYGWNFIGSDISKNSIASAEQIVVANPALQGKVECRWQANPRSVFHGVLDDQECVDFTMCNPPFHASAEEAEAGTRRKVRNLSGARGATPTMNFAGIHDELICEGGESQFIRNMIRESLNFSGRVFWFSTLVSKQAHLDGMYRSLQKAKALEVKTIPLGTGNKSTRIVAWTFLDKEQQKEWQISRWKQG